MTKIISWNVNGIRACYKKGLTEFLQKQKPDIFCVQETKAHLEQCEPPIAKLGMEHSYWSSAIRKGYSGVATFCHKEPEKVMNGIGIADYDSEGRFVITQHKGVWIYNVYFPNGGSGDVRHNFKQDFLKKFKDHLEEKVKSGEHIILLGDYNVAHREIDVYDPVRLSKESGFLPEERQWFDEFLNIGFVDTYRMFYPNEEKKYTWWSYREFARVGNRGWRIDYICVSESLKSKVKSADILDHVEGSDHCPVVLEIDL